MPPAGGLSLLPRKPEIFGSRELEAYWLSDTDYAP